MDAVDRACRYVRVLPASVSGSGGHNAAFVAAASLVHGFLLSDDQALEVLRAEFNGRCSPPWSEGELRHKVTSARAAGPGQKSPGWLLGDGKSAAGGTVKPSRPVARAPEVKKRQEYDPATTAALAGGERWVDWRRFLAERSPVFPLDSLRPEDVFAQLFRPGEKVLVFRSEFSQGDWGVSVGDGGRATVWALGDRPGVDPVKVPEGLPKGGPAGLWFLAAPVSGKWEVGSGGKATRRSQNCVSAWRYMVLESDEAEPEVWLPALCRLPLPVAAVYESGGRSVHALIEVDARSKGEWDGVRDRLSPLLTKFGCDGGAMSAVRLSRVPNVMRYGKRVQGADGKWSVERFADGGRLQRLLYLAPRPKAERIALVPRRRSVGGDAVRV